MLDLPPSLPFPSEVLTFPRSDYSYASHRKPAYWSAAVTDVVLARGARHASRAFKAALEGGLIGTITPRVFAFAVLDKVIQL